MSIDVKIRIVATQKDVALSVLPNTKMGDIIIELLKANLIKSHNENNRRLHYRLEHSISGKLLYPDSSIKQENIQDGDIIYLLEGSRNPLFSTKSTTIARFGSIVSGLGLIGLGVWDGISNPASFVESEELLVAGIGLVTIGMTGNK